MIQELLATPFELDRQEDIDCESESEIFTLAAQAVRDEIFGEPYDASNPVEACDEATTNIWRLVDYLRKDHAFARHQSKFMEFQYLEEKSRTQDSCMSQEAKLVKSENLYARTEQRR